MCWGVEPQSLNSTHKRSGNHECKQNLIKTQDKYYKKKTGAETVFFIHRGKQNYYHVFRGVPIVVSEFIHITQNYK
jgi:hypothetical protein